MATVTVTRTIDAPLEKVFATWDDEYGDIYKFSSGLSHSQLPPRRQARAHYVSATSRTARTGSENASLIFSQTNKSWWISMKPRCH